MKSSKGVISVNIMTGEAELVTIPVDGEIPIVGLNAVAVWLIRMNKSFYIWLSDSGDVLAHGPSDASFSNLIVAMPNLIEPSEGPLTSTLIRSGGVSNGNISEEYGDSLARRLARRFKQQVFLSEQLERYYSMPEILFSIEKKLVEFLVEQNSDSS